MDYFGQFPQNIADCPKTPPFDTIFFFVSPSIGQCAAPEGNFFFFKQLPEPLERFDWCRTSSVRNQRHEISVFGATHPMCGTSQIFLKFAKRALQKKNSSLDSETKKKKKQQQMADFYPKRQYFKEFANIQESFLDFYLFQILSGVRMFSCIYIR